MGSSTYQTDPRKENNEHILYTDGPTKCSDTKTITHYDERELRPRPKTRVRLPDTGENDEPSLKNHHLYRDECMSTVMKVLMCIFLFVIVVVLITGYFVQKVG